MYKRVARKKEQNLFTENLPTFVIFAEYRTHTYNIISSPLQFYVMFWYRYAVSVFLFVRIKKIAASQLLSAKSG